MTIYEEIKRFFRKNECEVEFGWLDRTTFGICWLYDNHIVINIALFIADTFIHEYLHRKYPNRKEEWIQKKTKWVLARLSDIEIIEIAKMCSKKSKNNEDVIELEVEDG